MNKTIVLSSYVVRNNGTGTVDVEETVRKFHSDVVALRNHEENDVDRINEAVNSVFDQYPGANITMPSLINAVLQKLGVGVEGYQDMHTRVHKFVQANSGEKREDGALFRIGKGKGSGVARWAEFKEKEKPTKK